MPNGGRIDGADHFGDLTIASGGTALMESDVYVWGTLDDGGDPTTLVTGAGRTIVADGWQLTNGFIDRYPSGGTRMRMRHPGLVGGGTIQFTDVDFSATEGDPGLLAHAIDTTTGDVLNILYYFQSVPEPNSFLSRTLEEGGANITMNPP